MLDINLIREQPERVREALIARQNDPAPVDQILATTNPMMTNTDNLWIDGFTPGPQVVDDDPQACTGNIGLRGVGL